MFLDNIPADLYEQLQRRAEERQHSLQEELLDLLRLGLQGTRSVPDESVEEAAPTCLAEFVTEAGSPGNRRRVAGVDVFTPAMASWPGLRLVDTPGLERVFVHNSEATRTWMPNVAVALVTVSAERPLSEEDRRPVAEARETAPRVVVVLTKVDLRPQVGVIPVAISRAFMTDWGLLWWLLPIGLVGGLFRRHAIGRVPWEVEKNLRRLAGDWTEAVDAAVDDLRTRAAAWVDGELATLDRLRGQQPAEAIAFRTAMQRLEGKDASQTAWNAGKRENLSGL